MRGTGLLAPGVDPVSAAILNHSGQFLSALFTVAVCEFLGVSLLFESPVYGKILVAVLYPSTFFKAFFSARGSYLGFARLAALSGLYFRRHRLRFK